MKELAKAFNWELILPPQFDEDRGETNRQKLSPNVIRRLSAGRAMF